MHNISYWLNKVGFSFANRFIVFFFGFASYFLMVRHLEKEDFGVYSIFFVIIMITELAISAFVQNGFIKYYLDKKYEKNEIFVASLVLNLGLTMASSLVLFSLSEFAGDFYGHSELSTMLKIHCINAFLLVPYTQLYYYLNAEVDFKSISLLSLIRFGSFFVAVLVSFFFFPEVDQVGFVKLQTCSIGIGALASLYHLRKIEFSLRNFK